LTVTLLPATVSVSERRGPVLAATTNDTCPGPDPDGCGRLIHDALVVAFHWQPAPVASDTPAVCDADGASRVAGATLKVQPVGCEIETV
jgi:hypothetical protein